MTVWVDSDSCPAAVRENVADFIDDLYGQGKKVKVVFIANRVVPLRESPAVSFHQSSPEKESADNYIVSSISTGDMVLTKDFLLAERTLKAGIITMNFDGRVFEMDWLKRRIEERNLMEVLYNSGSINRYRKKSRSEIKNREFALSFSREIDKILQKGE